MSETSPAGEITDLLGAWNRGEPQALEDLAPLVYGRLRRLAASFLRHEQRDHVLQTTALIHEAFLRLVDQNRVEFQNRQQFFATAGQMMRRILLDRARARRGQKRGGGVEPLPEEVLGRLAAPSRELHLVELDEALQELEREHAELARLVELRFFVGLTGAEIAAVTGWGTATVHRRWRLARAWLYHRLLGEGGSEVGAAQDD